MQRLAVDANQIRGEILLLTPPQQHYLRRVLRLRAGDRFLTFDGSGAQWLATLGTAEQPVVVSLLPDSFCSEQNESEGRPWIVLAACLPKQGFDEVVRQVTELGVNQIVPILSDRTLLQPSPNKLKRWQRIAREAAEQSERLTVPCLMNPVPWVDWLQEEADAIRYLCVARTHAPPLLSTYLSTNFDRNLARVVVAIGPEGGWTHTELESATAAGYTLVTLGQGILRAVTASVVALSILRTAADLEPSRLTYGNTK